MANRFFYGATFARMLNAKEQRCAVRREFAPTHFGSDWRAHDLPEQTAIGAARRNDETPVIADQLLVCVGDNPHATRPIKPEIIRASNRADLGTISVAAVKHVMSRKASRKDIFGLRKELRIFISRITR
jgi:hypothetical protein